MKGLFSYDGLLAQIIMKIFDYFLLGLLWIVLSVPLITIGASTTALYYTMNKVIRRENGKLIQEFWHGFVSNFKQTMIAWPIVVVINAFFLFDAYYAYTLYIGGALHISLLIIICVVAAFALMWSLYIFPYISWFKDNTRRVFKNCFFIFQNSLRWSVLLLVVSIAALLLLAVIPAGILFIPTGHALVMCIVTEKVFRKYKELDSDTDE